MSVELKDGHVWVEVTSHRARQVLERTLGSADCMRRSYGVWPENGGWPHGEYYQIPNEHAHSLRITGVKVRKIAPKGDIFLRWTSP